MFSNFLTKITVYCLRHKKLTGIQKARVMSVLLDNIGALPYKKVVTFDDLGTLEINGRQLSVEQAISFKESVAALKDNYARKLFNEQKKYMAIEMGVHNGLNPETIMFSKACLWDMQEEENLIKIILPN